MQPHFEVDSFVMNVFQGDNFGEGIRLGNIAVKVLKRIESLEQLPKWTSTKESEE